MQKLLDAIVRSVISYIAMWLQAKKAERLEAKVKQLESRAASKEIERKLAEKLDADLNGTGVASPSAWNAGKLPVILLVIVLAMSGCVKYVEGRWPLLPAPPRPTVPETPLVWAERESILARYAQALENLVRNYNKEAKAHNQENGYDD